MENKILKVPTSEMLRQLRLRVQEHKLFYENDLDELAIILKTPLIEIELAHDLKPLQAFAEHQPAAEAANSKAVHTALVGLSPAMATDERIWFALATSGYREYAFKRWLNDVSVDARAASIKNHLFASSPRNRFRDHAIARLWWIAHYTEKVIGSDDADKALTVLNLKRRYAGDFLDRTGISSSPGLARAIMRVAFEYKDKLESTSTGNSTEYFRDIMKEIDLMAGRKAIAFPGYEDFEDDVRKKFQAKFGAA